MYDSYGDDGIEALIPKGEVKVVTHHDLAPSIPGNLYQWATVVTAQDMDLAVHFKILSSSTTDVGDEASGLLVLEKLADPRPGFALQVPEVRGSALVHIMHALLLQPGSFRVHPESSCDSGKSLLAFVNHGSFCPLIVTVVSDDSLTV